MARLLPPAIIFVNNDLVEQVKEHIIRQLHINQVYDGYVFDGYLVDNPTFLDDVKAQNLRILVIRSFQELENRELADVAAFVKNGLISIEQNKFGPPRPAFRVLDIAWGKLGIFD